jgi:hypothetical protein
MNLLKREAMPVYRVLSADIFVDAETFTRKIAADIATSKLRAIKAIKQIKCTSAGTQTDHKGLKNNIRMFLRNSEGDEIDPNKKFYSEKVE